MKKIATTLFAGAFGSLMLLPVARAQDWRERDAADAIDQQHEAIQNDHEELRQDLRHGDYGAAAREQNEIDQRREDVRDRQDDLNSGMAHRYNHDEGYGGYDHGHHGESDDD
jgi:hypothetical protein